MEDLTNLKNVAGESLAEKPKKLKTEKVESHDQHNIYVFTICVLDRYGMYMEALLELQVLLFMSIAQPDEKR